MSSSETALGVRMPKTKSSDKKKVGTYHFKRKDCIHLNVLVGFDRKKECKDVLKKWHFQ